MAGQYQEIRELLDNVPLIMHFYCVSALSEILEFYENYE